MSKYNYENNIVEIDDEEYMRWLEEEVEIALDEDEIIRLEEFILNYKEDIDEDNR